MDNLLSSDLLKFATASELKYYETILRAKAALTTPLDYALYVSEGEAKAYPHTKYLNDIVLALVQERLYASGPGPAHIVVDGQMVHPETGEPVLMNAMVSMPVQHGKSFLLSGHLPSWYLSNFPDEGILFVTHSGDYAEKYGLENREHVATHPELGIAVSDVSRAKDLWMVEGHKGFMLCVGVGSTRITGRNGGLIVMDDLIGSEEDALSATQREKVLNYYYARLRTRRKKNTKTLYVGTRWHYADLPGTLQANEPDKWFIVNLPAVAFDTTDEEGYSVDPDSLERDPFGRRPGEALCPELHDIDELMDAKRANPTWFASLYQGRPSLSEGALFRTFPTYRLEDERKLYVSTLSDGNIVYDELKSCIRFGIVDTAVTTKTSSDFTVFGVFDLSAEGRLFVHHIERVKIPGDQHDDFIKRMSVTYDCDFVGVEKAPYSFSLIQRLQRDPMLVIRSLAADKDKYTRAIAASQLFINDRMFIPLYASWKDEFVTELQQFDRGEHDDQVDVVSYAARAIKDLPTRKIEKKIRVKTTIGDQLAKLAQDQGKKKDRINYLHEDIGLW